MRNRISSRLENERQEVREDGPQRLGDVLAELLAIYQIRFPESHVSESRVTVVETPVVA